MGLAAMLILFMLAALSNSLRDPLVISGESVSLAALAPVNPVGLVAVGGVSLGIFFSLVVLPSVYILVAKDHAKARASAAAQAGVNLQPAQA